MEKEERINKYIKQLDKAGAYDNESMHCFADDVLCDLLEELGYEDVVEVYKKLSTNFWYA